jgi:fructokinase
VAQPYAAVMGEALVDLLESDIDGERYYREAIGGAPLNVAVGLARLGAPVQFLGSVSRDALGGRITGLLAAEGVGMAGVIHTDAPTAIALTTFHGAEPQFRFYANPASYGMYGAADLPEELVANASVLYCGSIALLQPQPLAAARRAWTLAGPLRVFDPNVRQALLAGEQDAAWLAEVVLEFAAAAHLVKLSQADAAVLFGATPAGATPAGAAQLLRACGAGAVVVTQGAGGALVSHHDIVEHVAAVAGPVVDSTGAGDATMAALISGLLRDGVSPPQGWAPLLRFAMKVAGLCCRARGGAIAMPTSLAVRHALG